MDYQSRLLARKREFGVRFPSLTESGKGQETTIPAPMGYNYFRSYQPNYSNSPEQKLLPGEKRIVNLLKRFEY